MTIVWKDAFGYMQMEVDGDIHFLYGTAEFVGRDGQEYTVPVGDILTIRID